MADLSVVVIDSREKNNEIFEFLSKNKIHPEKDALDVGDIMILGKVNFLIERKTDSDFISSLISARLYQQMRNLAYNAVIMGFVPVLLFIGEKWKMWKFRKIRPAQIHGAFNTIQFKFGIHIIEEKNEEAAAFKLLNLIKMFDPENVVKKIYPIRTISKKNLSTAEYSRGILEGFPGISAIRAKRWFEKYGTLKKCMESIDNGDLVNIDGFGKKMYDAIKEVYK